MSSTKYTLEYSKLSVISNINGLYSYGWFLWEVAVCSYTSRNVDYEIAKTSMSRMLNLSNVLQLVIHCLYYSPLREKQLSDTYINAPFMLLFSFVISCMPSTKSLSKRRLPMYPLSPTNFPYMNSTKALYSRGFLSSTSPDNYLQKEIR